MIRQLAVDTTAWTPKPPSRALRPQTAPLTAPANGGARRRWPTAVNTADTTTAANATTGSPIPAGARAIPAHHMDDDDEKHTTLNPMLAIDATASQIQSAIASRMMAGLTSPIPASSSSAAVFVRSASKDTVTSGVDAKEGDTTAAAPPLLRARTTTGDGRPPVEPPPVIVEETDTIPRMTEAQCARLGLMTEADATLIFNAPAPPGTYSDDAEQRWGDARGAFPAMHQWLSAVAPETLIPHRSDSEEKHDVVDISVPYKPRSALERELLENMAINKMVVDKEITDDQIDAILARRVLAYERTKAGMQLTRRHGNPLFSVSKRWADNSTEDVELRSGCSSLGPGAYHPDTHVRMAASRVRSNRAFTGNPQRQARIRLVSEIPREVVGTPGPGYYHERVQGSKPLSLQDWKRDIAPPMAPVQTAWMIRRVKAARGGRGGRTMNGSGGKSGPGGRWTAQARPPTAAPSWQTLATTLEDSAKQTNPDVAKLLPHSHKPWLARRLASLAQSSIGPGEFTLPKYFDDLSIAGRRGDLGVGVPFDRVERSRVKRQERDARTEGLSLIKSTMGQPGTASTLFGSAAHIVTGGPVLAKMVTAEVSLPPSLPDFMATAPGTSEVSPTVHSFSTLQRFTHYAGSQPNARDLYRLREKRANAAASNQRQQQRESSDDGSQDSKQAVKPKPSTAPSARTSVQIQSIEEAASSLGLPSFEADSYDTPSSAPIDISMFRPEVRLQSHRDSITARAEHTQSIRDRQIALSHERQTKRQWVLDKDARQAQAAERARRGDWQKVWLFTVSLMARCRHWRDKLQARRAITSLGDLREQTLARVIAAKNKWLHRVRLSKRVRAATIIQQLYRTVTSRRHHQRAHEAVGTIIGFFEHVRNRAMVQRMIEAMQYRRHVRRLRLQRWWRHTAGMMGRARRAWLARLWEVVMVHRAEEVEEYRDYILTINGLPLTHVPPLWHPPRRFAGHHAVGDERIPAPETPMSPLISQHASSWLTPPSRRSGVIGDSKDSSIPASRNGSDPSSSPPLTPSRRLVGTTHGASSSSAASTGTAARRFNPADMVSAITMLSFDDEDGRPSTMMMPHAKQASLPRYMRSTVANTGKDLVSRRGGTPKKASKTAVRSRRPVVIPTGLMRIIIWAHYRRIQQAYRKMMYRRRLLEDHTHHHRELLKASGGSAARYRYSIHHGCDENARTQWMHFTCLNDVHDWVLQGIREMYQIHAAPRGQVLAKTHNEFNRWRTKQQQHQATPYHA